MTEYWQISLLFWLYLNSQGPKCLWGEAGESGSGARSGRDGQVHVLLLGRGWRDGHVVLLFLRASGCWQGRALAVVWASPLAAALAFLLVLHSPILKPDLHLFLWQVQVRRDLDAPESGEVHVWGELSLQLQKLGAGEGCAHAFAALKFAVAVFCEAHIKNIRYLVSKRASVVSTQKIVWTDV